MNLRQATDRRLIDQQGFVLVTSLIFLVVITLLAISAMGSSTLQERMASNLRAKSNARQAADAALRHAETILRGSAFDNPRPAGKCYSATDSDNCLQDGLYIWKTDGLFASEPVDESLAFLAPALWKKNGIQAYADGSERPAVAFTVEDDTSGFQARDLNPDTAAQGDGDVIYRITARAQSNNRAGVAVTQSIFEKRY